MILKKKIEIAAIVCSIGLCSFGQNVCASEFMRLPKESNEKMEHLVQTRLLKEQRDYLLHAQLITKINLEKKILEKPVFIPGTSHQITTRERAVLERIVEAEATDKDIKSKILVANVILNRVRSKEFPDSIEKVVFQRENGKVQFSPTADGRYDAVHVTKSSRESVKRALEGEDYSEGALYFVEKTMANPRNVSWFENNLTMLFTYEGHSFYK
ncbi:MULTISPECIES: cell wall hydrolase [Anaerostipes]|uniref:cell wall hydrolase n=1 Tax=Anaerostipes TaxID=207244 RepID=UPI000950D451|nr:MULTISPECIES: cell wall hydrolase [unclassified Anaerostipes]MCI5623088.1 cell wall hydrolase [Anaerostipes sp.]MDY2725439.1 cell wall hydrolase [Anaerostipes faecalis]OLR58235.1 hydrolase [Anaerostipes sp. 494a]